MKNIEDAIGSSRLIRRAYEQATSERPDILAKWHAEEILAVQRRTARSGLAERRQRGMLYGIRGS